ncbi:magnesium transporter CorA family protein [Adlercreutzia caecimuris]|uniref:magnesium transporter CorA family protein n=1 Tax=Adlercreutzia caecimuris TaxID=671266 RepID=UPI000EC9D0C7|nr:CorA family divalent cation transporter [Adlercreutzia caecimuris]MCR2037368.1 magnesium transporter CorA [Adlercreutzia caecimuris]NBJ65905.1 magnesium transporter CorA [Adlercreutzia caecimuris]
MATVYELGRPHPLDAPSVSDTPRPPLVKVITSHEFSQLPDISQEGRSGLAALEPAEMNFVELYPSFLIGSFAVPDKSDPTGDPDCLSFYLDASCLIFIDDGNVTSDLLKKVATSGILTKATTSHCLYALMKSLIADDFTWFSVMEDSMEALEEAMLDHSEEVTSQTIMGYRRAAMKMGSYYQQIAVMADLIADNENKVMSREEARAFEHVSTHASHLANRAETLREYSLQLRELHQTQIDLKQNSTMQILTIVTVMFAPLTLVTGWFGMNLTVLPGLDWPYMAATIITLALIMIVAMVLFFKKKNWL